MDIMESKMDIMESKMDNFMTQVLDLFKKQESKMDIIESKLESKLDIIKSKMDIMESKMDKMESKMDKMESKMDKMESNMVSKDDMNRLLTKQHESPRNKIRILEKISGRSSVCGSFVTTHYVVYKEKMFGISVAHTPCYVGDNIPAFALPVPDLDVTIWIGIPPTTSLLNITDSIVSAEIGDTATAFGLTMEGWPRAWQGMLVGKLGLQESGRHFTNMANHHKEELLFQGTQRRGMSGGAVLNGNG